MSRRRLSDRPTVDIGPYRLAHRIAVGGMAEVYRALWPQTAGGDRAVVIKRLLPALVDDALQREMFDHEARLGRRIDHPNVVSVFDHGEHDGAPYIVLEYVFGVDLYRLVRWLRRRGESLPTPLAAWIGCELLAGLGAVHAANDGLGTPLLVVHRDVSPANVFLSVHGDVKLGDLGIARASLGREGASSVRAKGKLGYLPPEQVAGKNVDQRGDVFSAAVVIAELLMSRPLFGGATEIGVLLAIRDGDVSAFRAIAHTLPAGLPEVVLAALERRPQQRTASARAFREALAPYANEGDGELRQALGALVIAAMDEEAPAKDHTSLARTIERDAESLVVPPPALSKEVAAGLPPRADARDRGARASDLFESMRESGPLYRIDRDDAPVGVFTLAKLVRAVTTGDVRATDRVRVGGAAPQMLANVPELARHLPPSTRTPNARRRTQMAETSELYELGSRSMLAVLVEALLGRDAGLLLCEHGSVRKEIYLERGLPSFVTSNQPGELLGETLVEKGAIDRAELDMALAIMPRFEGRLGETLVALGLVDAVALFRHIADQVRERVLDAFLWTGGHAALYRGVEQPERAFPLELDVWELLEEGARRRVARGMEDAAFAGRERDVLVRADVDPSALSPTLSDRLAGVAMACAGPRSLAELDGLAASRESSRAAILVLLELGIVRWHEPRGERS